MKKTLLALAILASSTSAMAYYATPGVRVSEPIIENHGFQNVEFKEIDPKLKKNYSVNAKSVTRDVQGKVMSKIRINGWHNIAIYNPTQDWISYKYTYQLNCGNMHTSYTRNIDINPHGQFSDSAESKGDVVMETTGQWQITANTYITSRKESVGHPASATLYVTN